MTTDTITLPRSVVEQALDALEYGYVGDRHQRKEGRAIANLRAAIEAAKQEREAELAAWRPKCSLPKEMRGPFTLGVPTQETVDYWGKRGVEIEYAFTTPQPQVPEGISFEDFQVWFDTMFKESGVDPVWLFDVFHQWSKYAAAPKKEG